MYNIKKIESEEEYLEHLSKIEEMWEVDIGTSEYDYFNELVDLVEKYEKEHFALEYGLE